MAYVVLPESLVGSLSRVVHILPLCLCNSSRAQVAYSEQVQVKPPLLRTIDPPPADATAADLEARADELRAEKLYLDALDYYRAALTKEPSSARLAEQDRHHRTDDAALPRGQEIV